MGLSLPKSNLIFLKKCLDKWVHFNVVYDPADISILTIECEGFPSCQARPLVILSHSAAKPKLPEHFEKTEPSNSRLLNAAKIKNEERKKIRYNAISFTGLKGGEN